MEEIAEPEQLDHNDRWSDVKTALASLSEDERLSIHLFYLEDQAAELARQLLNLSLSGFYCVRSAVCRMLELAYGSSGHRHGPRSLALGEAMTRPRTDGCSSASTREQGNLSIRHSNGGATICKTP